jgi:hypothetical protein
MVQSINSALVVQSQQDDILRWVPTINDKCTTKAAYSYLASLHQHILPQQGCRNLSPQVNSIVQKVWKDKIIPLFLKTFAWRLIRRALATAERAARYSSHIDNCCSSCGLIENDVHLLFLCDMPRLVWNSSFRLSLHLIDPIEDGIQSALPLLLPFSPSEQDLSNFLFIAWYIWKARNDLRFQRRKWNSFQVLHSAHAQRHTHNSAMKKSLSTTPPSFYSKLSHHSVCLSYPHTKLLNITLIHSLTNLHI